MSTKSAGRSGRRSSFVTMSVKIPQGDCRDMLATLPFASVHASSVRLPVSGIATTRRRNEVITGVERRRKWSAQEKAAIVAESLAEGVVVSEVARRHGLSPQQVFGWRARLRDAVKGVAPSSDATPAFKSGVAMSLYALTNDGSLSCLKLGFKCWRDHIWGDRQC